MEDSQEYQHHDTPTKNKNRGAVEFNNAMRISYFKEDVFRHFGVSHRQGWAMISEHSEDRRHHNTEGTNKSRRKPILSAKELRHVENMIKEFGEPIANTKSQVFFLVLGDVK